MRGALLRIEDLHVEVFGHQVLNGIWLNLGPGETHIIMGPNASGKTTLAMAILGHPAYKVVKGRLLFNGMDITHLSTTERVKLGIGVAFQNPPAIRGVKLGDLLAACVRLRRSDGDLGPACDLLREVGLDPRRFLNRDINVGFSGGEKRRAEIAQVLAMRPKLMILDEPDSGVDIDSLKLIGSAIRKATRELGCATLVITHYRHIVPYIRPTLVHVLYGGRIVASGRPSELLDKLEELGYSRFAELAMKEGWQA
ncbi:Fe-S cluster assembly ATPase SufC [Candidatus Bathyarchaeota archaeon]|nr:MAG: Fe-S cluster assembly ATPase SufC [Candidatus Bathyarchaeota archaeon]